MYEEGGIMKNLLDAKLCKFKEDFNIQNSTEEKSWERFVNYEFFSQLQPGRFDTDQDLLDQICIDSQQFSAIQGAVFLMNDQIICEQQDIDDILKRDDKGFLELYFLTFDQKGDFEKQLEYLFQNLDVIEKKEKWISILAYAISSDIILRWTNNPVLNVVSYSDNSGNMEVIESKISSNFSDINRIQINKKSLLDIINSNENNYKAELTFKQAFLMNSTGKEKLGNAYIACISATELIRLMTTPDGLLRRNIFDDNVRDSQGFSAVNKEIYLTLKEHPEHFVLFNNGITIVCRKVTPDNGAYVLENPQIVNGCQTCSMIYQAYRKDIVLDDVQVVAKIVGSNKELVTQGIVRGANRQNIVYEEAFETTKEFHKKLERYFEINQVLGYDKIYYERRSKQYADNIQIKPYQKIGFHGLIQAMTALFINHVEDSHRHEYTLLKKYGDVLFVDVQSCQPYYLAAFLYLNVDILFREQKLPKELKNYKMHIILLIKEMEGGISPDLSSKEIDGYCERLLKTIENGKLRECALNACEKFEYIRKKWISVKGKQYQYGIKDSAEFKNFLIREIHGTDRIEYADKVYTGYVMNVELDKHNTLFGFIEHVPNNVFFHEFDNPDMDRSYVGKKVSFKIVGNGSGERAINVRLITEKRG